MSNKENPKNLNKHDQLQRAATANQWGSRTPWQRKPKPELGQPGGSDDPRRMGLSGAGVRWYLRFIKQGIEPDEARRRVDERRAAQAQASHPQESIPQKRGASSQEELEAKQMRVEKAESTNTAASGQETTHTETVKLIKVAVLAREYPERMLSREEQTQLEDALLDEISSEACIVQFEGIHFKLGYILVDCVNQQTVEWMKNEVAQLKGWKGVELMVCVGDDIPRDHNITVYFPKSEGKEDQSLLNLVQRQNKGLSVNLWKVFKSKVEDGGKLLNIGIDNNSAEKIKKDGYHIYFGFGKIPVHGLKKKRGKKRRRKMNQGLNQGSYQLDHATQENPQHIEETKEILLAGEGGLAPEETKHNAVPSSDHTDEHSPRQGSLSPCDEEGPCDKDGADSRTMDLQGEDSGASKQEI